jgi:5-methylcytosine-specific restriction endonuclease McrA
MKLSKTEVNKLLIEERKKLREKQKHSDFMKRTLSIYNGQKKRASEFGIVLPFTLDELRSYITPPELNEKIPFENRTCRCGVKLTIKNVAIDHKTPISRGGGWDLINLQLLCKSCNFRKGSLTSEEYKRLLHFAFEQLEDKGREDLFRRLTLGGKWSFGR